MNALDEAQANAVRKSARAAARYAEAGELEDAMQALRRAKKQLAQLRARLPWHARLVRDAEHCLALAERATHAPRTAENPETGETVEARARLARRAERAVNRQG